MRVPGAPFAGLLFAALVVFDVIAHLTTKRQSLFKVLSLLSFALAILFEILEYPYGGRNDELAGQEVVEQTREITNLRNSTQALRTAAEVAHSEAERFRAQIADSKARD